MNFPFLCLTWPSSHSLSSYTMCFGPWPTWWAFTECCQCLSCTREPKNRYSLRSPERNNRFPQLADWTFADVILCMSGFIHSSVFSAKLLSTPQACTVAWGYSICSNGTPLVLCATDHKPLSLAVQPVFNVLYNPLIQFISHLFFFL